MRTTPARNREIEPSWEPRGARGGRRLVYAADAPAPEPDGRWVGIVQGSPAGPVFVPIVPCGAAGAACVAWSPDASLVCLHLVTARLAEPPEHWSSVGPVVFAADACQGAFRRLEIAIDATGGGCSVHVTDHGTGVVVRRRYD